MKFYIIEIYKLMIVILQSIYALLFSISVFYLSKYQIAFIITIIPLILNMLFNNNYMYIHFRNCDYTLLEVASLISSENNRDVNISRIKMIRVSLMLTSIHLLIYIFMYVWNYNG